MRRSATLTTLLNREHNLLELLRFGESKGIDQYSISALLGIDLTAVIRDTQQEIEARSRDEKDLSIRVQELTQARKAWQRKALLTDEYLPLLAATEDKLLAPTGPYGSWIGSRFGVRLAHSLDFTNALLEVRRLEATRVHLLLDLTKHDWSKTSEAALAEIDSTQKEAIDAALSQAPKSLRPTVNDLMQEYSTERALHDTDVFVRSLGNQSGKVEILRLFSLLQSGPDESKAFVKLLDTALSETSQLADEFTARSSYEFSLYLLVAVFVVLFTAGLSVLISLALTRHLGRLAERSKRIAEGDLTVPGGRTLRGPVEISTINDTLDSLAENLRKIQKQSAALAAGELEPAILEDRASGPLGDAVHSSVQALFASIQDRETLKNKLSYQANHDTLTGLPNRTAAMAFLGEALEASKVNSQAVCVYFVDLDGFKKANDLGGHALGDEVLRRVGDRICSATRPTDMVSRLGGDEFLVVSPGTNNDTFHGDLAKRIVASVSKPLTIDGFELEIGASVGYATGTAEFSSGEILNRADLAMYSAKRSGRNEIVAFESSLEEVRDQSLYIEREFAKALAHEQLALHYQPIVDRNGSIRSIEALVRWTLDGTPQSPGVFIPILESTPAIIDLGRWALRRAAVDAVNLHKVSGVEPFGVAVNLSLRHVIHSSVVDDVREALAESGLRPDLLTVEVTETASVSDIAIAIRYLDDIRALGVKVAIDDFGTGYTSIGQLSRFPCDILKIDREFIDQIHVPASHHIVGLIIDVGHTLGLVVVAEGVETQEQLDELWTLGCDRIQGYFVGKPITVAKLHEQLSLAATSYSPKTFS